MSYRGRFSKGCESCRARKVKVSGCPLSNTPTTTSFACTDLCADICYQCDEAKPSCGRCSRLQLDCAYRDQDSLLFRNETSVAAQRAEDSWRKRSKLNLRENSEKSTGQSLRKAPSSATLKGLGRSIAGKVRSSLPSQDEAGTIDLGHEPVVDIQTLAISPAIEPELCEVAYARFLYDFVTHGSSKKVPGEPSDGIFTFVPALYERAPPNSILVTITRAVSYINFANRCNSSEAAARGEELFGRGIRMLSQAVSDKQKAASDEVLCSTYLMGVYEVRPASSFYFCLA